ncbi:ABC transporter substrate-binding protein [Pusillimonas sp.]|uniref:ABC transporter substrate-binding protein n=1 Tax=Pusillimonas sp. TaxID=3040095 RepID=UPI0029A3BA0A|nr:ABC transporter substrate-binding protein [Pusillimonas sp.]MDX3895561.1 ABC transporter substrate-binding protein [Pusillimonas sp.]
MNSLHIGIVVPAFFYVPYWAAHENGWYEEAGLDARFTVFGGIDPLSAALKAGRVDIGIGSPEHVVHDVEAGGELRMVGGNVNRLTHSLITQAEIRTLKDLRGKTLGVSALSGGTSSLFIDILEREGLHYPEDYTIVEAGVVPPRHDQLLQRKIDAAMQTDPHNYMAEDCGLNNLGPVSQWIPYFQFNSVNARASWAKSNEEALINFLQASIRASQWVFKNRDESIAIAERHMKIERKYLERAWHDHVADEALPSDLRLERKSIETALEMMRRDRSVKLSSDSRPEKYVDTSYLAQAQRRAGVAQRTLD